MGYNRKIISLLGQIKVNYHHIQSVFIVYFNPVFSNHIILKLHFTMNLIVCIMQCLLQIACFLSFTTIPLLNKFKFNMELLYDK